MLTRTLSIVSGKSTGAVKMFTIPDGPMAVNVAVKLPEASVVVGLGLTFPKAGSSNANWTAVPAGAGFPFINT
ncbi:hypothetical protein QUG02_17495 [Bacillus hominis]|uniref:Uncharacterized protein n=1 Tax=Bacillus hominis TaxID=2817478 RepID=A0ABT7RA97_9BACI|nr:hypothetical protein [Bacillus hominis]MDM5439858.1 hypothetical protein [Bacillus hominis]